MASLPMILAGPILRRVTPELVSVWIALSKSAEVTLDIWEREMDTLTGFDVFVPGVSPLQTSSKSTIRIGSQLHLVVVSINLSRPLGALTPLPLIPGTLYSYNLSFKEENGNVSDLKSSELLVESKTPDGYYGLETDTDGSKFFENDKGKFVVQIEEGKAFFEEPNPDGGTEKISLDPMINLPIGYRPGFLPSFVVPPIGLEALNLAHGSCRNPAGYGKDCLAALDFRIKPSVMDDTAEAIAKRMHQLFLTGDQIYSDIIPLRMMANITRLGNELIGFTEKIAVKTGAGNPELFEVTEQNFPAQRREKLIHKSANLTATNDIEIFKVNHVLSFGEYAATYIHYWSYSAWHVELFIEEEAMEKRTDYLSVWDDGPPDPDGEHPVPPTRNLIDSVDLSKSASEQEKQLETLKSQTKEQYEHELPDFIDFRKRLPYVRRVLANVPVFMIADDHDVTDDWYINKAWKNAVLTSPLGTSIVRNALMAYTLFQDWGNDPLQYEAEGSSKKTLLERLQLIFADRTGMSDAEKAASELRAAIETGNIALLFGLDLPDETPPPVKWHYSVPCGEITTHVLDTRTRRSYETINAPPGLLSDSAMDDQIPMAAGPEKLVIFVSPAPVLGPAIIEEILQPVALAFDSFSQDPEPWAFCPPVFEKFLARVQQFKKVIFLSGDIHNAGTLALDYWKKGEETPSRMVQLISSALKQAKFAEVQFFASGFTQELFGSLFYPVERLGFNSNGFLEVTNPHGKVNRPKLRIRLRKEPVLLPTQGWPPDSVIVRKRVPGETPDWTWRMTYLKDERPDDDSAGARPEEIRLDEISPDIDSVTPGEDGYTKVLTRHQEAFRHSVARREVFNSNLGLVNFSKEVVTENGVERERISVIHSLLFWLNDDDLTDEPQAYTVYIASLDGSTDEQPKIL